MTEVDLRSLIRAVQKRPVIWDKHHPCYKDRNNTKRAWVEIFKELNIGYELMDQRTRMEYGNSLMKKWSNIRDSYQRSLRKMRDFARYGGKQLPKTYIYSQDLQFLRKSKRGRDVEDAPDPDDVQEDETSHELLSEVEEPQIVVEPRERYVSFVRGLAPTLETLDEDEMLEFEMAMLRKASELKRRRKNLGRVHMAENPIGSRRLGVFSFFPEGNANFRGLNDVESAQKEDIDFVSINPLQPPSSSEAEPRTSSEPPEDPQRTKRPQSPPPRVITPPELVKRQRLAPPPALAPFPEATYRPPQLPPPPPTRHPPPLASLSPYHDEFFTFGQHVANQLRCLPLSNAIVCQNYINNYLAEERLKVINEEYYCRNNAGESRVATRGYYQASATASNSSMEAVEDLEDDFQPDQKHDFVKVEDNSVDCL